MSEKLKKKKNSARYNEKLASKKTHLRFSLPSHSLLQPATSSINEVC
jgi:hypothetical protein